MAARRFTSSVRIEPYRRTKINNVIGQALLARHMGKPRVIAETGAGQHGVATATICARFGLQCDVYQGAEDVARQAANVYRMKLLGANVIAVESGSRTLKDALNEAMRDWATNVENTFYIIGTVAGPHPYPAMVRDFQRVIGDECLTQMPEMLGGDRQPDAVVACVGGGSNAMGIFIPIPFDAVKLYGVEAAGDSIDSRTPCSVVAKARPAYCTVTTLCTARQNGQVIETHSISAGLDYPGVEWNMRGSRIQGAPSMYQSVMRKHWPHFTLCRVEGHHSGARILARRGVWHETGENHVARSSGVGQFIGAWRQRHARSRRKVV